MSENNTSPALPKSEERGWLPFLAKLTFFLAVILVVLLAVLSSLGGKSEVLHRATEDFISARIGGKAAIGTFNQMTFYPNLSVDFEDLSVEGVAGARSGQNILSAEKVTIAVGFWDMTFGTGKLKTLNIVKLRAAPGALIDKGLSVDRLAIIDEGDEAFVRSEGKIGSSPYSVSATLEKTGKGKGRKYTFGDVRPFEVRLGAVNMAGRLENLDVDTMNVNGFSIGLDKPVLRGNLDLYHGGDGRLKIKGDLEYGDGSPFQPDILLEFHEKPTKFTGDLTFSTLLYSDAENYNQISALYDEVGSALGRKSEVGSGYDFGDVVIDSTLFVKKFVRDGVTLSMDDEIAVEANSFNDGALIGIMRGYIDQKANLKTVE